jgi:hypothetical protein
MTEKGKKAYTEITEEGSSTLKISNTAWTEHESGNMKVSTIETKDTYYFATNSGTVRSDSHTKYGRKTEKDSAGNITETTRREDYSTSTNSRQDVRTDGENLVEINAFRSYYSPDLNGANLYEVGKNNDQLLFEAKLDSNGDYIYTTYNESGNEKHIIQHKDGSVCGFEFNKTTQESTEYSEERLRSELKNNQKRASQIIRKITNGSINSLDDYYAYLPNVEAAKFKTYEIFKSDYGTTEEYKQAVKQIEEIKKSEQANMDKTEMKDSKPINPPANTMIIYNRDRTR